MTSCSPKNSVKVNGDWISNAHPVGLDLDARCLSTLQLIYPFGELMAIPCIFDASNQILEDLIEVFRFNET